MLALLLALSFGCGGTPMEQQIAPMRTRRVLNSVDTLGVSAPVKPAAGVVFHSLHTVLPELGLAINFREPDAPMRVGSCYQKVRTRLGKELLSAYLDCGETQSLPNADRYEVALTVISTVQSNPDGSSTLSTFVIGVARNDGGGSGDRLWCRSTGKLEEEIRKRVEG